MYEYKSEESASTFFTSNDVVPAEMLNESISNLLEGEPRLSQIEDFFENLAESANNFSIIGLLDSAQIVSLLNRYLNLIKEEEQQPPHKLARIFYVTSLLAWGHYLNDLNLTSANLFMELGKTCKGAKQAGSYLMLLARLVNEDYIQKLPVNKLKLLEKLIDELNSDVRCDSVSIARALHALVLLESSDVEISEKLKGKAFLLVQKFEMMLKDDHDQTITPDQINRVVQYLDWIHGEDAKQLLLEKFERLCRPIPSELQCKLAEKLKAAGFAAVPEGRIGSNFCDLAVIVQKAGVISDKKNEKKIEKIDIELDGRKTHYDEDGQLKDKDVKRDHKLRARGVKIIRIKTRDETGKKKTPDAIEGEILRNLRSLSSEKLKLPQKTSLTQPEPFTSNPYATLALETDKNQQEDQPLISSTAIPESPEPSTQEKRKNVDVKNQFHKKTEKSLRKSRFKHHKKDKKAETSGSDLSLSENNNAIIGVLDKIPERLSSAWFKKVEFLASRKNPEALRFLGFIYFNGYKNKVLTIEKSLEKAFDFFTEAAELGDPAAYHNLGYFYLNGNVVTKNVEHAIRFFERAADLGVIHARYVISMIYTMDEYPYSTSPNAMSYFVKAINHANSIMSYTHNKEDAMNKHLALQASTIITRASILKSRDTEKPTDKKSGLPEEFNAILANIVCSDQPLSVTHQLRGTFVPEEKDISSILPTEREWSNIIRGKPDRRFNQKWYKHLESWALKKHIPIALKMLADLHDLGFKNKGVYIEKNNKQAFEYYLQAAHLGDAISCFKVGKYFLAGSGVTKNIEKGLEYLEKAISLGHLLARLEIAKVYVLNGPYIYNPTYLDKAEEHAKIFIQHSQSSGITSGIEYESAEAILRMVTGRRFFLKGQEDSNDFSSNISEPIATQNAEVVAKDLKKPMTEEVAETKLKTEEITETNFEQVVASKKPFHSDFWKTQKSPETSKESLVEKNETKEDHLTQSSEEADAVFEAADTETESNPPGEENLETEVEKPNCWRRVCTFL